MLVIGLLIILFARKFQNNESLSTSASEDASFADNVLYTFEITGEQSYQHHLTEIARVADPASKLIEVTANVRSEQSKQLDGIAFGLRFKVCWWAILNNRMQSNWLVILLIRKFRP